MSRFLRTFRVIIRERVSKTVAPRIRVALDDGNPSNHLRTPLQVFRPQLLPDRDVAKLDFPILRSKEDWESGAIPDAIRLAQGTISWAEHLVIFFPLWLGTMPALLKAFLEQAFRPGFAIAKPEGGKMWKKLLAGKTARIVVTMGMPAFIYRWYFRAHSLKSFERNILGFCGIGPIKESLIGMIEAPDNARREKWLAKMRKLGRESK